MRLSRPVFAVLAAATALAGCETLDLSHTVEDMERAKCREEASRYPGAIEQCEGIGRGAEY